MAIVETVLDLYEDMLPRQLSPDPDQYVHLLAVLAPSCRTCLTRVRAELRSFRGRSRRDPCLMLRALTPMRSMLHLDLRGNCLGPKEASAFADAIRGCLSLRTLDVSDSNFCRSGMAVVAPVLATLVRLRRLRVRGNSMEDPQCASHLASALTEMGALTELGIIGTTARFSPQVNFQSTCELVAPVLPRLRNLTRLDVPGAFLHRYSPSFAAALNELRQLRHIDLYAMNLCWNEVPLCRAITSVASIQGLTFLELGRNDMTLSGARSLSTALLRLPHLRYLGLSRNRIGILAMRCLAPALGGLSAMESLDLSHNCLCNQAILEAAPQLGRLRNLRKLNLLSHLALGSSGTRALLSALANVSTLCSIKFPPMRLDAHAIRIWTNAMRDGKCALQDIDMASTALPESAMKVLAPVMGVKCTAITHMNLSHCRMGPQGALYMSAVLSSLPGLVRFNIASNQIGVAGMDALASPLAGLGRLEWLQLEHNGLGPKGADAVATLLLGTTSLRHLSVSSNKLGPKGAVALAGALHQRGSAGSGIYKPLLSLQELDLHNNDIGTDGVKALCPALASLGTIWMVGLWYNAICDAGVNTVREFLPQVIGVGLSALSTENMMQVACV